MQFSLILFVLIGLATASSLPLQRQRRDLIGYNRQQNNVLGFKRMPRINKTDETNDLMEQILKFLEKEKNSAPQNSKPTGRSSRFRKFRKFNH